MNRRKAIANILLLAGTSISIVTLVKLLAFKQIPDLKMLRSQEALITDIAETIIPATDTPGARAANVSPFIIAMVEECTPQKQQIKFLNGLEDVNSYAKKKFNLPFIRCSAEEKQMVIDHFEKRDHPYKGIAGKISHHLFGASFFTLMKTYTVYGYCNSMLGATNGMSYNHMPGKYEGCVTLSAGQKCWATK